MTREEAIKILEEEAEFLYGGDEPYNKIAFDMAIKALEQEPVVRCKDCIHGEKMNRPWADGRQIVFCWNHGKERFTTGGWYCGDGEGVKE